MKITIDVPECPCGCGQPVKVLICKYAENKCRYKIATENYIINNIPSKSLDKSGKA